MAKRKQRIAVDLDDVLFDFLGYFFDWNNQRYGTSLRVTDMVFDKIWEAWGGSKEEAAERIPLFWRDIDMMSMLPMPGAVEALNRLKLEYQLAIVSARDPSASAKTEAWINKYFPDVFDTVVIGIANPLSGARAMTKAEQCKQIGASVLIDDQLVHAEECASAGMKALLFGDLPHNQSESLPPSIVRVEDWDAVVEVLAHDI